VSQQVIADSRATAKTGLGATAITQGFDGTDVLDGVTLTVEQGEIVAIIGPSGTGKTTLLRLLALFHSPDSGSVTVEGTNVWEQSNSERLTARRRIGMVFQEPNLFDTTVRRNVHYGLQIRRSWRDRVRRVLGRLRTDEAVPAVAEALRVVGLADSQHQQVESLSGGEAQRVAFARALAYDPDYLLLDEPTSDLDPRNTAVLEEAMEAARAEGRGVAIATHDMNQAERVADRVAVMVGGELIEVGPTDRVFSEPHDERARKFIDGELVY
jgi:tungstate transport system ATP-binding protein